MHAHMGES